MSMWSPSSWMSFFHSLLLAQLLKAVHNSIFHTPLIKSQARRAPLPLTLSVPDSLTWFVPPTPFSGLPLGGEGQAEPPGFIAILSTSHLLNVFDWVCALAPNIFPDYNYQTH